jgi:hypothetical protein
MRQSERVTQEIVSKTRDRIETYRGYAEGSWIMQAPSTKIWQMWWFCRCGVTILCLNRGSHHEAASAALCPLPVLAA